MRRWPALIGFILLSLPQGVAAQGVVNLASIEHPPYTGEQLKHDGMITQIIQEAYARVGYQVGIRYYSAAKAAKMTEAGDVDGLAIVQMRRERKEWVLYSDPMPATEMVFYKRKNMEIPFDGKDYHALKGKGYFYGTGTSYAHLEGLDSVLLGQTHIFVFKDDLQALRRLEAGRIDLVIIDKFVAQYVLSTQMPKSIDALNSISHPLSIVPNYLAISRMAPQAQKKLDDFNRGLAMLAQDGRIHAILAEHGLKE